MEGMQAATAVIALAEVARQTALLIRRVCNAHKDAEGLCQKTQHLAQILDSVGKILQRREDRHGDIADETQDHSIDKAIKTSLKLCSKCLTDMKEKFEPLVNQDSGLKGQQLRQRLIYVRKNSYIAARERDISIQMTYLSVALQCLSQEEQTEQQAIERQSREQASRQQLGMQEAFLRQLLGLFQFVFQAATRASSSPDDQQTAEFLRHFSEQLGHRERSFLSNDETLPTLEDIFATSGSRENLQQRFEEYVVNPRSVEDRDAVNSHVEETEAEETGGIETIDLDILSEEAVKQEPVDLDQSLLIDLSKFANQTTLLLAIKQGNSDLVRNLLNDGADVTTTDSYQWTVLHHAAFCLYEDVVDVLLENERCTEPGFLNAQAKYGETALIFAAQRVDRIPNGQAKGYNIAQKLVQQPNCDVNISDGVGSAFYYAIKEGKPSSPLRRNLVQLMVAKGGDVESVLEQIPEAGSNFEFLHPRNRDTTNDNSSSPNQNSSEDNANGDTDQDMSDSPKRRKGLLERFASRSKIKT